MSSGSFKETSKHLNSFFASNKSAKTIPVDLQTALQAYLDKHKDVDDAAAQRLHEELKTLYQRHVLSQDDAQTISFLQVLLTLESAITGVTRKSEWWKLVLEPILNGIGHQRGAISYAAQLLLAFLNYDNGLDNNSDQAKESSSILQLLLTSFITRARTKDVEVEALVEDDQYIAEQLEDVLIAYGRRKPKDFMMALDGLILDVKTRFQAMSLLCDFVRHQPPHLYTVSETPLIEHLLKCLMIDTSSTIIQIALTTLIMFLPHIPGSMVKHLPRLFLIYTRLLCWEQVHRSTDTRHEVKPSESNTFHPDLTDGEKDFSWTKLETLMTTLGPIAPNLNFYFTFLYGMYPLNFMSYIRRPRRYLKSIDFPRAEAFDFDQVLIKKRTDEFRKLHLLHPNLFMTTQEEELEDDRWLKSDPADVVGECMNLCISLDAESVWISHGQPAPASSHAMSIATEFVRTEDIPPQSLSEGDELPLLDDRSTLPSEAGSFGQVASANVATNISQSRAFGQRSSNILPSLTVAFDSPHFKTNEEAVLSPAMNVFIKGDDESRSQARSESGASSQGISEPSQHLAEPSIVIPPSQRSPRTTSLQLSDVNNAFLQREVLILRNDLNFERYLKQQHLSHIGQLQRRRIKEATLEADTQNLIQTNKTLKAKLEKANETYASLKRETATGRQNSKKFETDLSSKVRSLRREQRSWEFHEEGLTSELNEAKSDCAHLRRLVVESEARELLGQQKVASMEIQLEQVDELHAKITRLEHTLQLYEAKELDFERTNHECKSLRSTLASTIFQIQNQDQATERALSRYKQRIEALETQLVELGNPSLEQDSIESNLQQATEHALQLAHTKYLRLQKENSALTSRLEAAKSAHSIPSTNGSVNVTEQ